MEDILNTLQEAIDREIKVMLDLQPRVQKLYAEREQLLPALEELSFSTEVAARDFADPEIREFLVVKGKYLKKVIIQLRNTIEHIEKIAPPIAKVLKQLKMQFTIFRTYIQEQDAILNHPEILQIVKENLNNITRLLRVVSQQIAKLEISVAFAEELLAKSLQVKKEIEEKLTVA